jgi:hypothetical protein
MTFEIPADDAEPSRYLGIAIDHGESFEAWLNEWGVNPSARASIKHGVIDSCLEQQLQGSIRLDGIVIGMDLVPTAGPIIARSRSAGVDVWLGLPDQTFQGRYDDARSVRAKFPIEPVIYLARDLGVTGIKVSVALGRHTTWEQVADRIEESAALGAKLDQQLIIEPYFGESDKAADRKQFLRRMKACAHIRGAKLDVHDPPAWSRNYGEGFAGWLARSEGLDFDLFTSNLEQSLPYNCAGALVGAAVWGIRNYAVLDDEYLQELERRLALLRAALDG